MSQTHLHAEIATLRTQLAEAQETIRCLRHAEADFIEFVGLAGLTESEAKIALLVARRGSVSHESVYQNLYGLRTDCDMPQKRTIDTFVCKLRQKLKPLGIRLETVWRTGYRMDRESCTRFLALRAPPLQATQKQMVA